MRPKHLPTDCRRWTPAEDAAVRSLYPGDTPVRLATPTNPRLDGTAAVVERVEGEVYHVLAPAAATGRFRALIDELAGIDPPAPGRSAAHEARDAGYSGEECSQCGSMKMRRNGSCLCCASCGTTSGCS